MSEPGSSEPRRLTARQLIALLSPTVILIAGVATVFLARAIWVGLGLLLAAMVLRLVLHRTVLRPLLAVSAGGGRWWYNRRTGEVEEGRSRFYARRDGPYATREDALRSREIARERAADWNAED